MGYFIHNTTSLGNLITCKTRVEIIAENGKVNENSDGTVSVFVKDIGFNKLKPIQLTKPCCEALDPSYIFDIDNQKCRWGEACNTNNNSFKIILNPKGNDSVIFSVDENSDDVCSLDISFDYLFQFDCNTVVDVIKRGVATNVTNLIHGLSGNTPNCLNFIDMLETLDISMRLEKVNSDTSRLETIYEEPIFKIGASKLYDYLINSTPNTGIYITGQTNINYGFIKQGLIKEFLNKDTQLNIQNLINTSLTSPWVNYSTNISDPSIISDIINKKINLSLMVKDSCVDFSILIDRIKLNRVCVKDTTTTTRISKSPSFDLIRICDNKKSWFSNTEAKEREFDLRFRGTHYDINHHRLAINSKEVDLDINPANAIEQDMYCYIRDNNCILSPITTTTGTCGDNGVNLIDKVTTSISSMTTLKEFKDAISSELIDVKSRQTLSSYPTLRLVYERYLNTNLWCNTTSSAFNYCNMQQFSELVGSYWIDLIEQVVPATTIWGSTNVYSNTLFDQQKYKYKKYSLFTCNPADFDGDVVSPTSGTNENISVITTTTSIDVDGFESVKVEDCTGVFISQINCGSEFVGKVIDYTIPQSGGGVEVISECTLSSEILNPIQTSIGVWDAKVSNSGDITGPITYTWDDSNSQTTQTAVGLTAGTYTVSVSDTAVEGCDVTASITFHNLEVCLYSLFESPEWLLIGQTSNGGLIDQTWTISSLIVNGSQYVVTGSEPTILIQPSITPINWIPASNNDVVSGTTIGLTYTDGVDFINNTLDSYGITTIKAQIATGTTLNQTVYGISSVPSMFIIRNGGDIFEIEVKMSNGGWTKVYTENRMFERNTYQGQVFDTEHLLYDPWDCTVNPTISNGIVIE